MLPTFLLVTAMTAQAGEQATASYANMHRRSGGFTPTDMLPDRERFARPRLTIGEARPIAGTGYFVVPVRVEPPVRGK